LQPLLTMSNREFRERFGHSAASWRGKKPLQRNAILALAHYRDATAVPLLKEQLSDPRPVIRGTAAWALGKIGARLSDDERQDIRKTLEEQLNTEVDPLVRREIEKGIRSLLEEKET